MSYTDKDLFDMTDEELEQAFRAAKADVDNAEIVDDMNDNEEVEVEDLEQPEMDSDDDTSSDEDDTEVDEEDSEDTDATLDEEAEVDEEQPEANKEVKEAEEQPVQKFRYKANGQDFEFTEKEILERFGQVFAQSMNYTQKMQQIKPYRKTIDALEQAGLGHNDLNFMIDVLKGDKGAISQLLKRTGVDALDLGEEDENRYVPKDYGRDDTELAIRDIVEEIGRDKEYATTHNVLARQWDDRSRQEFANDPEMIRLLHIDVKSGTFDQVNSIAQKLKVFDNGRKSDLDYYKDASQEYFNNMAVEQQRLVDMERRRAEASALEEQRLQEVKRNQAKQEATKQASEKRKAAAPAKRMGKQQTKVVDYLDDSDEGFDEWYNDLQSRI